ncbi:MAG TPA: sugar-binding domain-containing protein [Arenibaculum sp.]|nr:sugar-binding domain-containing protein [Arenibaculum sp.]
MPDALDPQYRRRLDLAARAAWLYYIKSRTQDEIAAELGTSRQNVQRLVALALAERLIKFRLDHELAECIELQQRLRDRFGLTVCEVVPGRSESEDNRLGIGIGVAQVIDGYLSQKAPMVLALGTGRTLREGIRQVPSMSRPQHKIVSLVGNLTRDGRASPYDVAIRLADRVEAPCYPLPMPVVADTVEERETLHLQRSFAMIRSLVAEAKVHIMGIGQLAWGAPLHVDGFITDRELAEMMELGAIGEMRGWTFDARGEILSGGFHDRLTAIPLSVPADHVAIIAGAGAAKVAAMRAALTGRLANGVITDEFTAAAVLAGE